MKYDVIIVGAGPAGMAAAHTLINNNISCCVIDKQVFPRNKLCAGGLTNKAIGIMNELKLGKEFCGKSTVKTTNASLYVNYDHVIDLDNVYETHLVDRFEFDDYLVESYKAKRGAMIEGLKVSYISTENKKIMLSDNNIIDFEYIIGADGAVGVTRKLIDKNHKTDGFCLQIDIDKNNIDYNSDKMSLYYGIIPYGYGWIFPKEDYVTIGIGSSYDKNLDYKKEFETFLDNLGAKYNRDKIKGAFIPFGDYVKNPINDAKNMILVGDAAGLADPISGEGIYFAMLSGIKGAEVITKAINNDNREILSEYVTDIEPITNSIKKGNKLKKTAYKYRKLALGPLKNRKVADLVFNKCIYNSNYDIKFNDIFKSLSN